MAVGVVLVCGLFRQFKAQQRYHGAGGVGEVVDSVGGDGYAAGDGSDQQLGAEQKDIAENAHGAGQLAVTGADRRILVVLIVTDQKTRQQVYHI